MKKYLILIFSILFLFIFTLASEYNYDQIPRVSYVKGNVQLEDQNGGWSNCDINLPVIQGSRIVTGNDGRVEIEFDDGSAFRADSNCEFFISVLSSNYEKIETISGSFILKTISDIDYEVLTSTGSILVKDPSTVRIDVRRNGDIKLFVRDGRVYFRNEFIDKKIKEGRGIYIYNGGREYSKLYSKNLDDFDFWSDRRDSRYTYSESRRYIPNTSIYVGIYDLDHYGRWVFLNDYGYCWVPAIYDVEWAPYRYGYWRYCNPWGWTWISYEPWGWLPYHYGRWYFSSGFGWVWIPGHHWSISFWSPGLVRFSIWDNYIGWVPLGPGDYYCYDCGWNRNLTIVNNYTNINYYNLTNIHVRNAATIVNINDFRRGRPIVRRNSLVEHHHISHISESARLYKYDSTFINRMFSKNRIVRRNLNITPISPSWRKNTRISDVRRGIPDRNGSYRHRSPYSPDNRVNIGNGRRHGNITHPNNPRLGVDISRSNLSSHNRRGRYGPSNSSRNNIIGRDRRVRDNPSNNRNGSFSRDRRRNHYNPENNHSYHRNNDGEGRRNSNRGGNFHRNNFNIPHVNNHRRIQTEKPKSRNFFRSNNNRRVYSPVVRPHSSYHSSRNYSSNFNYSRRGNYHSSYNNFRRRDNSTSHYHRNYSFHSTRSRSSINRSNKSYRLNNYRRKR